MASLDQYRDEFIQRRFLTVPLAGALCWACAGVINVFVPPFIAVWVLFIATGSIIYVAMLLGRLTGEPLKPGLRNPFDGLFLHCVVMALMVYSIAIPFFLQDHRSLPLTVGILTGIMWVPFSWIIGHWVGVFHALSRSLIILIVWYLAPEKSFVLVPAAVVIIYAVTIAILEHRWRQLQRPGIANLKPA